MKKIRSAIVVALKELKDQQRKSPVEALKEVNRKINVL